MESLTISIFAFNEEAAIGSLIAECIAVLENITKDYEVLVINDGSRDRTRDIILENAKHNDKIRWVDHAVNLGFGPTLRDAFQKPSKSNILLLPGDGQIAPDVLSQLLPRLEHHDLILGWRRDRQDRGFRKVLSVAYNVWISLLLRRKVHDVDSIVLVKKKVIQSIGLK